VEKTVERVVEKRGGFGTALVAGLIAAAMGFAAARTTVIDAYLPEAMRKADNSEALSDLQASMDARLAEHRADLAAVRTTAETPPDLSPVETRLTGLSDQIATLTADLADLSAQVAPLPGAIDGLTAQAGTLQSRLQTLDDRLTRLEKQPLDQVVSEAAIAAYEREMTAMQKQIEDQRAEVTAFHQRELESIRATVAEQRAEVQALVDEARALEAKTAEDASLAIRKAIAVRLRKALDEGTAPAEILAELTAAGIATPDALAAVADDGVATMAALRESYPDAARTALAAARAENKGSGDWRAFLQRQLGARSVEPRDGDDADAILSRAEAALINGQLDLALSELAALPEPAAAAMADWSAAAAARRAAVTAADTLAQSLNTN
jgi:hypothetical protein